MLKNDIQGTENSIGGTYRNRIRDVTISLAIALLVFFTLSFLDDLVFVKYNRLLSSPLREQLELFISLILAGLYVARNCQVRLRDYGFRKGNIRSMLIWGILGGIAVVVLMVPLRSMYYGDSVRTNVNFIDYDSGLISISVYFSFLMIVIPMLEEAYYRGYIYTIIKRRTGHYWGAFITSSIFGLFHLSIRMFVVSYVLIFVYEKSEDIGSPILAHIIANSIWGIAMFMLARRGLVTR